MQKKIKKKIYKGRINIFLLSKLGHIFEITENSYMLIEKLNFI